MRNPSDRSLLIAMAESWARLADQAQAREEALRGDALSDRRDKDSRR
jgi:hypothetical protein